MLISLFPVTVLYIFIMNLMLLSCCMCDDTFNPSLSHLCTFCVTFIYSIVLSNRTVRPQNDV